ncbi:Ig domain-containing protein [Rhodococcus qingshengii]|uniref:Ig domain-containing protein n=1 Tax=Rhodococcus qingshengii TaxID=334542 RepID=UPI0010A6B1E3|nr:Ig domain-containing protein [Rhodococcus qingshengii]THJ69477.1 hypothetical protein EU244_21185 [Rhodococcus qingshengii]
MGINPDNAGVFDEGEIYVLDPNYTGTYESAIPTSIDEPLGEMWLDFGLIGVEGISYTPAVESNFFDGWGNPRFKGKANKGTLQTSFNALERNAVTAGISLPSKNANRRGKPKGVHRHLAYVTREDGVEEREFTTKPALLIGGAFTKSESGVLTIPMTADHFPDADGDLFITQDERVYDLVISTTSLPAGKVGVAYEQTLTATGGEGTLTWSKTGTLPAGLTLSSAGVLSGTPTAAGSPDITFKVTDSGSPADEDTQVIKVTVAA